MKNEPTRKLVIPEHLDELMGRIENAYLSRISSPIPASICEEFTSWLNRLKEFHYSLKTGQHPLLDYHPGEADNQKMALMRSLFAFLTPLSYPEINKVSNKVIIDRGIQYRLKKMCRTPETYEEATALTCFIDTAYNSSWGNSDQFFPNKTFRLIKSKEEWEKLLRTKGIELLTSSPNVRPTFTTIQVAMELKKLEEIYKEMGLYEDYIDCIERHFPSPGQAIKMFSFWHGIAPTAIFYIHFTNN